MQTSDLPKSAFPQVEKFEKEVKRAHRMFCCRAWQQASNSMRRKYPQYSLTQKEFRAMEVTFQQEVEEDEHFSTQRLRVYILNPLVYMRDICGDDDSEIYDNRRFAGTVLRHASYAGCVLGYESSLGDLEFQIRLFPKSLLINKRLVRPHDLFDTYKAGDSVPLLLFLNMILEQRSRALRAVRLSPGQRNSAEHAPSLWCKVVRGSTSLENSVLSTHYHLYSSLTRLVEPVQGHA